MTKLTLRIDLSAMDGIGPGKIALLEHIEETGSISAAGRAMKMSYLRAWRLVDEMNGLFRDRVTVTAHGGKAGGGAVLTPFGRRLVRRYREMEAAAHSAVAGHLEALEADLRRSRSAPRRAKRHSVAK
jgi:molybdate transport system regulatory protein